MVFTPVLCNLSLPGEGERVENGNLENAHKKAAAKPVKQVADLTRDGDRAHREGRREEQKKRIWL